METVFRNLQTTKYQHDVVDVKIDEIFIEIFIKSSSETLTFSHQAFEKLKAIVQTHFDKKDALDEKFNTIEFENLEKKND